jgi:hypothetical protein
MAPYWRIGRHLAALLLALVLAACGGPGGGGSGGNGPDPFFSGREVYGDELPEGAVLVPPEEFKELAGEDGFVWDSLARQERLRIEAEARYAADKAEILRLIDANPDLAWLLDTPDLNDPDIELLPGGEYLVTMRDASGHPFQVRTLGQADVFRERLASHEQFESKENQLTLYTVAFEALPSYLKSDFPAPEQLADGSVREIMAALATIEAALSDNLEVLLAQQDALMLGLGTTLTPQTVDLLRPPGYPASPEDEEGRGLGLDRTGNCTFSESGLYQNFWWPLKYYQTSVKAQGSRGSCTAFAFAAAVESLATMKHDRWLNLSEQHFYYQSRAVWQPGGVKDGFMYNNIPAGPLTYQFRLEEGWNYNPSRNRVTTETTIQNSCVGYNETCSDTVHQGRIVCTTVNAQTFCGSTPQAALAVPPPTVFMPKTWTLYTQTLTYEHGRSKVPWVMAWLFLMAGNPILAGLDIDTAFDNPTDGFVSSIPSESTRGAHAVLITGFIPAQQILNHPTASQAMKTRAHNSGGGFFVVKNSWGCGAGDAGYYYVPVKWADRHLHGLRVVERGPAPYFLKELESPPELTITYPPNGASFQLSALLDITFKAEVSDLQDGPSCCPVSWSSSVDGALGSGKQVTRNFAGASPGPRTITATAKDSKGNETSKSVTIMLTTSAPNVSIVYPLPGQYFRGLEYTFVAEEFSGPNASQPCSAYNWTSSVSGEGPWSGCTPLVSFATTGPRTITVSLSNQYGQTGSDKVDITVIEPPDGGPPLVNITSPEIQAVFASGQRAYVAYSVVDPSPEPPTSVEWSISYGQGGTQIPITLITDPRPAPFRPSNRYFRPSDYVTPLCFHNTNPSLEPYVLRMVYTNSEGKSATARVPIYLNADVGVCVN